MTEKTQQSLMFRVFEKLGSGYLFLLLPFCIIGGSFIGYHNPPDHPRYDSTTWIMLGGLSGLVIGTVAMGILTFILWMSSTGLRELE